MHNTVTNIKYKRHLSIKQLFKTTYYENYKFNNRSGNKKISIIYQLFQY